MADIKKELNDIKNAVYGREVRGSIHDGIKKINDESENSKQKADEAHDVMESIMTEGFDNAALEANFEQKLDDKIANLQPEWTGFKEDVTTQLAETDTHNRFESPINRKVKPKRPFISFVDDDGQRGFYTILFELAKEYNVPFTSAMITNRQHGFPGDSRPYKDTYYSYEEAMEMKESGLIEFVSHTKEHTNPNDMTDEEIHEDYRESMEFMRKWGFNHRVLVFPFGTITKRIIDIAKQYYDYSTTWGGQNIIVKPPFSNYKIGRVPVNQPMSNIKEKIDEAAEAGTWIIFRGHIDQDYPDYQEDWYREIIEYAQGKNFKFVKLEEGLQHFANVIEIDEDNLISYDGEVYGDKIGAVTHDFNTEIDIDTPLHYFKPYSTTRSLIRGFQSEGFPGDNEPGILETTRLSRTEDLWNFQYFYPLYAQGRNNIYIRYWNRDTNKWTEFKNTSSTGMVLRKDSVNGETPPEDFPQGFSMCQLGGPNALGVPNQVAGVLYTYRPSDSDMYWTKQEYKEVYTDNEYVRQYDRDSDSWGDWRKYVTESI